MRHSLLLPLAGRGPYPLVPPGGARVPALPGAPLAPNEDLSTPHPVKVEKLKSWKVDGAANERLGTRDVDRNDAK